MEYRSMLKLSNTGDIAHRGSPFGGASVLAEIDQMIAAGYGRVVTVGAFSTGVGGGAAAIIDIDQPQLAIAVPPGYTIRPFRITAQVQTGLVAADNEENEIVAAVDPYGQWTGDGTFTSEIPFNLRTDLGQGSACRVGSAFSGDMTTTPEGASAADPVLSFELDRAVQTAEIVLATGGETTLMKELRMYFEPRYTPYVVGPATVLVYWGGTVEHLGGFCQAYWVEAPTAQFFLRS